MLSTLLKRTSTCSLLLHTNWAAVGPSRFLASDGASTSGSDSISQEQAVIDRELPEVIKPGSEIGSRDTDDAALAQRQDAAVARFLEERFGKGRVALVRILQRYQVVVRGGQEEGTKLLDALSSVPEDADRGAIALILQSHHAAVRGAPQQAEMLLDNLLDWRRQSQA